MNLEAMVDEVNALVDRKTAVRFYHEPTDEPYSFLYLHC